MNRMLTILLLALAAGCASVKRIPMDGNSRVEGGLQPIETVEISNTCWYLFACLPIASGEPDAPNEFGCRVFRNSVNLENQLRMLQREVDQKGARRAINVTTLTTDEDLLLLLLVRGNIHTSAVLVK